MGRTRDAELRARIWETIRDLARNREVWKRLKVKKVQTGDAFRPLRSARIDAQYRILWEGPISTKRYTRPVLFIHDACDHNQYVQQMHRLSGTAIDETKFDEADLTPDETLPRGASLPSEAVAFAKPIPPKALLTPERMEAILESSKANILLTQRQAEVLGAECPLLIHGHAGSGKTTILCHRLAMSVTAQHEGKLSGRIVYLSYNDKLVKQAMKDTKEILRDLYFVSDDLSGVDFMPFQDFVRRYVASPTRFGPESYVPYGRFKQYYATYRRGNQAARRIPSEVAWHGIRSILKGTAIPPLRPPLPRQNYESLARRRREFPEDILADIYTVGEWYQKEVIHSKGLWDDQDLAWAALEWITNEQKRNPSMAGYSQVFCDEVQDLTEIEFRLLIALCQQPSGLGESGLQLVLSGDPLQTINPTGFKWSVVSSEVYRSEGRPVQVHQLKENFRSDKRIVAFANRLQEIRSYYMRQDLATQDAFEKDGDLPQILVAETDDEVAAISDKLGELPPESAVIVWPEEDDVDSSSSAAPSVLTKVDRQLDLYTVSEAKGLEFRLVVLHNFGSTPDAVKWKEYLAERHTPPWIDEIPLLYFLNRLYVAVTRAKSFLVVVDTEPANREFWSMWKEELQFVPRPDIRSYLGSHPAFLADVSDSAWRNWAETLFERADRTHDPRLYQRARRAYEKAGETQSIKRVDARLAELGERWEEAGSLYFETNDYEPAGRCFAKAEKWERAIAAYARLPSTPELSRLIAVYTFRLKSAEDPSKAALTFYEYSLHDDNLEKPDLEQLALHLLEAQESDKAGHIYERIAHSFGDTQGMINAARRLYGARMYDIVKRLLKQASATHLPEYELSQAQLDLAGGKYEQAIRILAKHGQHDAVVQTYEVARERGAVSLEMLSSAADSLYQMKRFDQALDAYEDMLTDHRSEMDPSVRMRTAERIGDCLYQTGHKREAVRYYRDARNYDSAARAAEELGRPKREVDLLRIEATRNRGDFDAAIHIAEKIGDERLRRELGGHKLRHQGKNREAFVEFLLSESWQEAGLAMNEARLPYGEKYEAACRLISAMAASTGSLKSDDKKLLLVEINSILIDPVWESYIKPQEMGAAYEKAGALVDAALYYESRLPAEWARNGWIKAKELQRDLFRKQRQNDRADRIDAEIKQKRESWAL